jgi:hypothetical protein
VVEIEPTSASVSMALKKAGVLTSEELSDRVSLRSAIIVKCFGSLLYDSISYSRCGKILIAKPCRTGCRTDSQSADSPVGSTCPTRQPVGRKSGSPENPGAGTPVLYTLGTNPLIIMAVAIGSDEFCCRPAHYGRLISGHLLVNIFGRCLLLRRICLPQST